jgi:hypothetical protein
MGMYGNSSGATNWHPGVVYLLALVLVEIAVMGALRSLTKHGG